MNSTITKNAGLTLDRIRKALKELKPAVRQQARFAADVSQPVNRSFRWFSKTHPAEAHAIEQEASRIGLGDLNRFRYRGELELDTRNALIEHQGVFKRMNLSQNLPGFEYANPTSRVSSKLDSGAHLYVTPTYSRYEDIARHSGSGPYINTYHDSRYMQKDNGRPLVTADRTLPLDVARRLGSYFTPGRPLFPTGFEPPYRTSRRWVARHYGAGGDQAIRVAPPGRTDDIGGFTAQVPAGGSGDRPAIQFGRQFVFTAPTTGKLFDVSSGEHRRLGFRSAWWDYNKLKSENRSMLRDAYRALLRAYQRRTPGRMDNAVQRVLEAGWTGPQVLAMMRNMNFDAGTLDRWQKQLGSISR